MSEGERPTQADKQAVQARMREIVHDETPRGLIFNLLIDIAKPWHIQKVMKTCRDEAELVERLAAEFLEVVRKIATDQPGFESEIDSFIEEAFVLASKAHRVYIPSMKQDQRDIQARGELSSDYRVSNSEDLRERMYREVKRKLSAGSPNQGE